MKKLKTVYVDDKKLDEIENAFKSLKKQVKENEMKEDEKWYIPFTNEQLKNIFGLTDEQIEKTKGKEGKLCYSPKKKRWFPRFKKVVDN